MKPEDIKVGETYYVRMKVTYKEKDQVRVKNPMVSVYGCDYMIVSHEYIHPTNEQPTHDPCRLFRKGDEVEYRPKDGRANPNLLVGRKYKVAADEPCDSGIVQVEFDGLRHIDTFVAYNNLELVTPVEELEPYFVMELKGAYGVYNTRFQPETEVCHFFADMHPHAKEAAEAECARLNAEHRKEQNNDK